MPCSSCTTGSPMRTSDRSRTIASTFERRAGIALAAAHDVRVELGFGDEREPRGGPRESRVQRRGGQRELGIACDELGETRRRWRGARRTRRSTAASFRDGRRFRRRPASGRRASRARASALRADRRRGDRPAPAAGGESARRAATAAFASATGSSTRAKRFQRAPELVVAAGTAAAAAAAAAPCRRASAGSAIRCPARSARRAASTSPCSATIASRGR